MQACLRPKSATAPRARGVIQYVGGLRANDTSKMHARLHPSEDRQPSEYVAVFLAVFEGRQPHEDRHTFGGLRKSVDETRILCVFEGVFLSKTAKLLKYARARQQP
jgi:hypothetical protein